MLVPRRILIFQFWLGVWWYGAWGWMAGNDGWCATPKGETKKHIWSVNSSLQQVCFSQIRQDKRCSKQLLVNILFSYYVPDLHHSKGEHLRSPPKDDSPVSRALDPTRSNIGKCWSLPCLQCDEGFVFFAIILTFSRTSFWMKLPSIFVVKGWWISNYWLAKKVGNKGMKPRNSDGWEPPMFLQVHAIDQA